MSPYSYQTGASVTLKHLRALFQRYYREICEEHAVDKWLLNEADDTHVLSMCNKVRLFLASPCPPRTKDKGMRWLGFIQGLLYAHGIYTLEELKLHNRSK